MTTMQWRGIRRSYHGERDGRPSGVLVWRQHDDGRSWLVSPINPITLAWWIGWRVKEVFMWRVFWPLIRFLYVAHMLTCEEGVAFHAGVWRTFSLRPATVRERCRVRVQHVWDRFDQERERADALEMRLWQIEAEAARDREFLNRLRVLTGVPVEAP